MRIAASPIPSLLLVLQLFALSLGQGQYQNRQYQSGGSFQGGSYQASNQQSHFKSGYVGPRDFEGQFNEQREISIRENIQGSANGGYMNGMASYGAGGGQQFQNYQRQGGMGGPRGQASRTAVLNTPIQLAEWSVKGSQVDIRLISYTNINLSLMNGTTCACPSANCNYLPMNQQNQCSFSFVIVISAADQSIQYIQSDFYPLSSNGIMNTGNWTTQYSFQMNTKPIAIDIFVQNLGVVIDSRSAQLLFFNHLSLVDSFVVDLLNFENNGQLGSQTLTLVGQQQQTQMQVSLNVQCINNMMGPYCDMTCNTNQAFNSAVICFSNRTNTYSACRWNTQRTQVTDCYVCTHGTYNGTCNGALIISGGAGVAYAFRTWTIVLGCLLGIALLLILCLIISYIIVRNKEANRNDTNIYRRESTNQRLISDEWGSTGKKTHSIGENRPSPILQENPAGSEDSYLANGVQQTTTTTTTTMRRAEHVV